ncbi:four-carbon acid sugar kinase family protein [Aquibacillus halophilus]|uniref:Four-carbon acid sugar kinase family protein n=1 Tax=Aquibacillus halophilus TaxID=930132 RepID=A0A6A8DBL3_9BACI|nr:four-carbon acid sugar kinase family protein [Aquibacillus halophilus]MRH41249.1 four-carbon acid sugar kinase family protein [Aquibacillus halophilus]
MQLPNLKLCFYGDDFTGSTDSMEALTNSGLRTVLFLQVPSPDLLNNKFSDVQCFGVAGVSRQMDTTEMENDLRPILEKLMTFDTQIVHYKTCSTFDSSPKVGSIGKVIDMGKEIFPYQKFIPLLVGVPLLKRYTVFGNLFVGVDDTTYRLDRHPTMSRHPVTPMNESDLRLHLAQQTTSFIELLDINDMTGDMDTVNKNYQKRIEMKPDVLLYDTLEDAHLLKAGELIWNESLETQQFVVGSSGVEYALGKYWNSIGIAKQLTKKQLNCKKTNQLLVASGSCSPVTHKQIEWALNNGFEGIKIPSQDLVHPEKKDAVKRRVHKEASDILKTGKSLIIYTALGPDDPSITQTKELMLSLNLNTHSSGKIIGQQLGEIIKDILLERDLQRIVIAGGDTSGFLTQELEVYGLEMTKPIDPGGPLCRIYSENERFDGLEIALKGGQVGEEDYLGKCLTI